MKNSCKSAKSEMGKAAFAEKYKIQGRQSYGPMTNCRWKNCYFPKGVAEAYGYQPENWWEN